MSRASTTLRLMGACVLLFSDGVVWVGGWVVEVYDESVVYFARQLS